jgi:hypothetical protein
MRDDLPGEGDGRAARPARASEDAKALTHAVTVTRIDRLVRSTFDLFAMAE